jgi:predicted ATP-dependent serine protease
MAERTVESPDESRVCTGMAGLDDVLGGGLDPNRLYLVEGEPGTGKTTLALLGGLSPLMSEDGCKKSD